MPEAAMHEDDLVQSGDHNVGLARQGASMQSVGVAKATKDAAYDQLGRGVLSADPCHQSRAVRRAEVIHATIVTEPCRLARGSAKGE